MYSILTPIRDWEMKWQVKAIVSYKTVTEPD
jgi:hypothetical protein